eukprot:701505-Alexandrium_andersonii.AAC.1
MAASCARSASCPSRLAMGGRATGATCGTTRTASPPAARTSAVGGSAARVSRSTRTQSGRRQVAWSRR